MGRRIQAVSKVGRGGRNKVMSVWEEGGQRRGLAGEHNEEAFSVLHELITVWAGRLVSVGYNCCITVYRISIILPGANHCVGCWEKADPGGQGRHCRG